ncbi:hypothetical protein [Kitasatospora paranensis]|uniref:SnoaL-like domain-containing protein n=1 Tax=Kitasatospora paranensis TaxID=258053 RepID=A0ABW2FRJ6_9ACTN
MRILPVALALVAALACPAARSAAAPVAAPAPPVLPGPAAAPGVGVVADFLAAYRDAVLGLGTGHTPSEVRADRLTPQLNARLDAWADEHRADPVFRVAGAVPDGWTLRGEGAAGGLAFVVVTEEFPAGRPAVRVRCVVRAADRAVVDLEDAL